MVLQLDFIVIKRVKKLKEQFRQAFENALDECGECLMNNVTTNYILDVFNHQGYWSGVLYNIYFNFKDNDFEIEYRHLGV